MNVGIFAENLTIKKTFLEMNMIELKITLFKEKNGNPYIIISEGKKHQVRRLTAAVGYPTLRLVRVAVANFTADELQPGEWRYLTPAEVKQLKLALDL